MEHQIDNEDYIRFRTEVTQFVKEAREVFAEFSSEMRKRSADDVRMTQLRVDINDQNDRLKKVEGKTSMLLFGGAAIVAFIEFILRVAPALKDGIG